MDNFIKTYEEMKADDVRKFPYIVTHPEDEAQFYRQDQTFATWREAQAAQKKWNRDCPGHVARKRRS